MVKINRKGLKEREARHLLQAVTLLRPFGRKRYSWVRPEDFEDIVTNVLIEALRYLRSTEPHSSRYPDLFYPKFVVGTFSREVQQFLGKASKRREVEKMGAESSTEQGWIEGALKSGELVVGELFEHALAQLSPPESSAIELYLQGVSGKRVAEKLGVSKRTGLAYISRGKLQLRRYLVEAGRSLTSGQVAGDTGSMPRMDPTNKKPQGSSGKEEGVEKENGGEASVEMSMGSLAVLTYRRDLPQLLKDKPGLCVAYHGDKQVGFAPTARELYKECKRLGIPREEIYVTSIEPQQPLEVEMHDPY